MTTEEFEAKLNAFLGLVPDPGVLTSANRLIHAEYYGELLSGTPIISMPGGSKPEAVKAREEGLLKYKKAKAEKTIRTNDAFKRVAGLDHETLLDSWADGGLLTSCNGFVGHAALAVGISGLGGFSVEQTLAKWGKQHCWVRPNTGEEPQFGDIYESRAPGPGYELRHVGVSVSVKDGVWHTVEGGQGGPLAGADKVARIKKPYNLNHVLGWVDMRRLTSGVPGLPDWLIGTWMIYCNDHHYVYSFNYRGEVTEKVYQPTASPSEQVPMLDSGKILGVIGDTVKLSWNREGGIEMFTYDRLHSFAGINERMTGVGTDGAPMTGVRL